MDSAWKIVEKFRGTGRHYMARVRCVCGTERTMRADAVTSGRTRSCGCLTSKHISESLTEHGGKKNHPREYASWRSMRSRCMRESDPKYPDYGGRGISIHTRWGSFKAFLNDMGPRPENTTLGRKDNSGNYSPENCQWETPKQQANNTRRNLLIKRGGITKTASQWADELGIKRGTLQRRFHANLPETKLFTPVP